MRPAPAAFNLDTSLTWTGLTVLRADAGSSRDQAEVEFIAHYQAPAGNGQLHEISHFIRRRGRWFYAGAAAESVSKRSGIPRNGACPCGSGRKYKRCCGRRAG